MKKHNRSVIASQFFCALSPYYWVSAVIWQGGMEHGQIVHLLLGLACLRKEQSKSNDFCNYWLALFPGACRASCSCCFRSTSLPSSKNDTGATDAVTRFTRFQGRSCHWQRAHEALLSKPALKLVVALVGSCSCFDGVGADTTRVLQITFGK